MDFVDELKSLVFELSNVGFASPELVDELLSPHTSILPNSTGHYGVNRKQKGVAARYGQKAGGACP
ncbi:hypothetical protein EV193_118101 [Herbihabitans rhizosphaerae]|uniref:Uncharacterized protein n=1 Tax=Herbihabitans rhizosphaerae TaxID=1872711 RepID=A0A4Q7KC77_9PSEU|nr:hypothetical protein EV193_118101 [Herbihabitans rhizosphaerae]